MTYPTGGDVITMLDGQRVSSADGLRSLIDANDPGPKLVPGTLQVEARAPEDEDDESEAQEKRWAEGQR